MWTHYQAGHHHYHYHCHCRDIYLFVFTYIRGAVKRDSAELWNGQHAGLAPIPYAGAMGL